jgi:hypothetical protein
MAMVKLNNPNKLTVDSEPPLMNSLASEIF